jgi:chromatin modification-related protein VID21
MMMIGAITKLQRKRETALHRQQESAKAAALRKQHNEANQAKNGSIHTPQEFSRMKHEREVKLQERQEAYRQQLMAQQQAKVQAMQRQMQGQAQGMQNGTNQPQRTTSAGSQGPSPPAQMTNGQPQPNGAMPQRPSSQNMMQNGFSNGMPNGMSMQMPNGQMQGMSNQQRLSAQSQQDLRMLMAQQRAYGMQTHGNQTNNLATAHVGQMQDPQMLAALAAQQRNQQNAANGTNGLNTSPRSQNALAHQPQQLSSGYQPALLFHQQQVAAQFPHFTPEQVLKLANERLKGQMQRMQANALSAASGSPAPQGMGNNMMMQNMANGQFGHVNGMQGGSQSPTQYAAALQRNMQHQAVRMGSGSPAMSNAHPVSRSATPQNPVQTSAGMQIQRPGSAMTGMGDDGSPRMM